MRFPELPPPIELGSFTPDFFQRIQDHLSPTLPDGRYLHWNDLRRRPPPAGLSSNDWWFAQGWTRRTNRIWIPTLFDQDRKPFWFCRLDVIDRATHELDRSDATREMIESIGDAAVRKQYRIDQIIEEAINSSVLEGAKLTTRAQAKAMIREGAVPRSHGERMVLNNFSAMQRMLDTFNRPLDIDDLLEIHSILGDDALDTPGCAGRFRTEEENVRVEDRSGEVWFTPPPASELPVRVRLLLNFANNDDPKPFLHPLVRAIVLHFWLAYLHPFVDGNGRMARALFYWQMLRSGYDFAQYLSISGPIDRSPRSYYLAFAHTETDEGDLTYFLLHQLRVLQRARRELTQHLAERSERLRNLSLALEHAESLNRRQQELLTYLIRKPHQPVTISGHAKSHGVSYLTARKDIQDLESQGYLRRVRVGRGDRYLPTDGFVQKLRLRKQDSPVGGSPPRP